MMSFKMYNFFSQFSSYLIFLPGFLLTCHTQALQLHPTYQCRDDMTRVLWVGMLVQDPSSANDVDAIFNQAGQAGAVQRPIDHLPPSSSSRSFTGMGRLLSGETVSSTPQPPASITHNIIFWSNGFTVDDGPLRRLDDPENASFLESIKKSEWPEEFEPADRRTAVNVNLVRKNEKFIEPEKPHPPFQGVGRTLGCSSSNPAGPDPTVPATPFNTAPAPSMGLVVDETLPLTSIQLRLADGTRMISRFNYHHTVRDIRNFIDASRSSGPRDYQLQTVGFPPKQLTDLDQTIEQAGLASDLAVQGCAISTRVSIDMCLMKLYYGRRRRRKAVDEPKSLGFSGHMIPS
ncbi:hypothetical protein AAG906_039811 [Vitis piasezkii]